MDEVDPGFWTDTELNAYINEGNRHYWKMLILAQNPISLTSAKLSIVAGTDTVALPDDFIKARLLEKIYSTYTKPLVFFERYDLPSGTSGSSTNDYIYRFIGSNLLLEPTPQTTETNALKLTYFKRCVEMDDDSESPEFDEIYHDMLVDFCVCRAKEKEEDGGDGTPFAIQLKEKEQFFKEMIENSTIQRRYTQPFGIY